MAAIDLGKVIEKIVGKIKKEERESDETQPIAPDASTTPDARRKSAIPGRVYLKALALHSLGEVDSIKNEVQTGNILIIRVTPLADKSVDDVKRAVGELSEFTEHIGGDIARLGEERIVLTPSFVRVWREKPREAAAAPEAEMSTEAQ
ncbi:MAG: cell division protein SepF [Candidatus Bathyarchaeota archaeon]|nr:cell division protein SepF [Candidatus Bathyarchaeota archaeon]